MDLLVTWYGDDFTGSAAVMEVLAFAGIDAVLFSDIPSPALQERFKNVQAVGIASTARTHDPKWMEDNLPAPLSYLDGLKAPILHYKVCSTFDSSPVSGSVGKAIEVGLSVRPSAAVPVLTAAPQMQRYQAFGNLFAGSMDGIHRLDRHPVMSRHPVTPMDEADLMLHLGKQTLYPTALIDLEALWTDPTKALNEALSSGARIISIDSMEPSSEASAGRLIWENRDRLGFTVGSQGVEYALVRYWQETGVLPAAAKTKGADKVSQIAAVSGSVSPTTASQLAWSAANGFSLIEFDATKAVEGDGALTAEAERVIELALNAASTGASPLVYSAAGPDDTAVSNFRSALSNSQMTIEEANARIGKSLGYILDRVLMCGAIRRAVVSGGDTSGHAMRALGLEALVALAPTIPGAALCTGYGEGKHDELQIALKGGQMGSEDFFGWIRDGGGSR